MAKIGNFASLAVIFRFFKDRILSQKLTLILVLFFVFQIFFPPKGFGSLYFLESL